MPARYRPVVFVASWALGAVGHFTVVVTICLLSGLTRIVGFLIGCKEIAGLLRTVVAIVRLILSAERLSLAGEIKVTNFLRPLIEKSDLLWHSSSELLPSLRPRVSAGRKRGK